MKIELNRKYENITTGVKVEVLSIFESSQLEKTTIEYRRVYDFEVFFKPVHVFRQTYKLI